MGTANFWDPLSIIRSLKRSPAWPIEEILVATQYQRSLAIDIFTWVLWKHLFLVSETVFPLRCSSQRCSSFKLKYRAPGLKCIEEWFIQAPNARVKLRLQRMSTSALLLSRDLSCSHFFPLPSQFPMALKSLQPIQWQKLEPMCGGTAPVISIWQYCKGRWLHRCLTRKPATRKASHQPLKKEKLWCRRLQPQCLTPRVWAL